MTKARSRARSFVILGFAAMLLSSCGIMGGTTRSAVQLDTLPSTGQLRPLVIGSVTHEKEGVHLMCVGSCSSVGFNDDDLANIEDSLGITLISAIRKSGLPSGDLIRIHVLIRKYFVGISNSAAVIFAGVDWALVGPKNQLLFQDSFYATSEGHFPQTSILGWEKDSVKNAIIKRIAQKALAFAAGEHHEPVDTDGTYSSFESAVATMPEMIKGWGINESKKVELKWAEMKTPIDWSQWLMSAPR